MYQWIITFVCICSFYSQVFANDQQTRVYEMDQLGQISSSQLFEPLVQIREIDQTVKQPKRQTSSQASGKIKVRFPQQIFLNGTVPFTPSVTKLINQRQELMRNIIAPIQFQQRFQFKDRKQLIGGAIIYDWSAKDSL